MNFPPEQELVSWQTCNGYSVLWLPSHDALHKPGACMPLHSRCSRWLKIVEDPRCRYVVYVSVCLLNVWIVRNMLHCELYEVIRQNLQVTKLAMHEHRSWFLKNIDQVSSKAHHFCSKSLGYLLELSNSCGWLVLLFSCFQNEIK